MKADDNSEAPREARQQVAALPYRVGERIEVLLISSRETRRWVLPKGWPMKGKSLSASAEREALEEAGLDGAIADTPVGSYRYAKGMKDGTSRLCEVSVFPMLVTRERKDWPEKAERTRRWVSIEEAAAAVNEPELREIIRAFGAVLRARSPTANTK